MAENIALVDFAWDGFNKGVLFPTLHNVFNGPSIELVSKELNHLAAILHVYAGGLIFMK